MRREFNIPKMKYAVKVIARFNKVIRMKRFIRSIKDHKKIDAGLKIQKFMKGLVVAKKYEHVYIDIRLHRNLKHFDDYYDIWTMRRKRGALG